MKIYMKITQFHLKINNIQLLIMFSNHLKELK